MCALGGIESEHSEQLLAKADFSITLQSHIHIHARLVSCANAHSNQLSQNEANKQNETFTLASDIEMHALYLLKRYA